MESRGFATSVATSHPVAVVTLPARTPDRTARARKRRQRLRSLRAGWRGRVTTCSGPEQCPWRAPGAAPCSCVAGTPCACERRAWNDSRRIAGQHVGELAASLLATSLTSLARRQLAGEPDAAIDAERARLLALVLRIERDVGQRERAAAKDRREAERLRLESVRVAADAARAAGPSPLEQLLGDPVSPLGPTSPPAAAPSSTGGAP